jgi:hypothetical protein
VLRCRETAGKDVAKFGGPAHPGVIDILRDQDKPARFQVDRKRLRGLVGYEKGNIHRPGVVLNVFSEGEILRGYNKEIATMLERACASPIPSEVGLGSATEASITSRLVVVHEYGSDRSEAIHDSLKILGGRPVDKTVIVALDEFFGLDPTNLKSLAEVDLRQEGDTRLPKDRFYVGPEKKMDRLVPYYANVLVLAYNTEVLGEDWKAKTKATWPDIEAAALELKERMPRLPSEERPEWERFREEAFAKPLLGSSSGGERLWPFEVGAWSTETLACILLDAVVSGTGGVQPLKHRLAATPGVFNSELFNTELIEGVDDELGKQVEKRLIDLHDVREMPGLTSALTSLARLFKYCWRYWELQLGPSRRREIETALHNKLVPNAAFYVCWYSQLRELVSEYPQLGSKLRVCPLPGRGFKGDWFLGVVDGSVSLSLGEDVLRTLCADNEEHKRFVRGVGLPVGRRYCEIQNGEMEVADFLAWPRARVDSQTQGGRLVDVMAIHQNALSRAHIPRYESFRGILGTLGRQLAASADAEIEYDVQDCINRLPKVVSFRNHGEQ